MTRSTSWQSWSAFLLASAPRSLTTEADAQAMVTVQRPPASPLRGRATRVRRPGRSSILLRAHTGSNNPSS
jgi:hypothetical protein